MISARSKLARIIMIASVALFSVMGGSYVSADGDGSDGGSIVGGGSSGCGSYWNTCNGASWRYFLWPQGAEEVKVDSGNASPCYVDATGTLISGTVCSAPGTTITGCSEVGGYWRYGWEGVSPISGQFIGVLPIGGNGNSTYRSVKFGGGMAYWPDSHGISASNKEQKEALIAGGTSGFTGSWDFVQKEYEEAVNLNVTTNVGSWGANSKLAWFCSAANDLGGGFLSRSNVRVGSDASNYKSTEWTDKTTANLPTTAGSGEVVDVYFSHQLKYTGSLPNNKIEVKTTWSYQMTINGQTQGINPSSAPAPTSGEFVPTDNEPFEAVPTHGYNITMPEIENGSAIITICEKIEYSPQVIEGDKLTGNGWSRACAIITVSASPPPDQANSCPIPGGDADEDYGNTVAQSAVRNSTKDSSWTETSESNDTAFVWAKPGDSIQFKHTLCFGAQAVRGNEDPGNPPTRPRDDTPTIQSTATIKAYTIPSTSGANYLFGKTLTGSSSQTFPLGAGEARPSSVQGADVVGDYFFVYYSPSLKVGNSADSTYRCNAPGASNFKASHYQVLGYESTSLVPNGCNAASAVNAVSDVGKIIEQDLEWLDVEAYIGEKNTGYDGYCGCTAYNSYSEAHSYNTPISYEEAKSAGSKIGHYVRRCDYVSRCGCCSLNCTGSCGSRYEVADYWYYPIKESSKQGTTQKAQVKVPYNYTTSFTLSTSQSRLYSGGEFGVNIQIHTNTRENSDVSDNAYATISKTSQYKIAAFVVSPSVGMNSVPGENERSTNSDICSYYNGGRDCEIVDSGSGIHFNPQGNLGGDTETVLNSGNTVTVPDLEVGTKFCIAVGVYPSDSHDYTSGPAGSGDVALRDSGAYWHYSEPVCRTITKKPTVEFHTSGIFTYGDITTSQTKKMVGYSLGQYGSLYGSSINGGSRTVFGSWSEYEIMAQGINSISDEQGMASGASFGGSGYPDVGLNSSVNPCTISTQSYANSGCSSSSIGNLSTDAFDDVILDRIISRYTDSNKAVNNSITSIDLSVGTCNLVGSTYVASDAGAGYYCLDNGTKYYRVNNATIFGDVVGSNDRNNTVVVDATGSVTISGNIQYRSYTGGANFSNIATLPQLLVFADIIDIENNVTNVDAWLIAGQKPGQASVGSYINTCSDIMAGYFQSFGGSIDANTCNQPLAINGPVFANTLYLNRTAGAGTGSASGDPAEIIRMRPDAYLWAYNQAQRFSQAVTTYSRELAPRY